jgi:chaperonin GroEL
MYKEILFNQDARNKILEGVNITAKAVSATLGPRGNNVIFEESSYPTITKDGVTVAQQVFLEDKFQNMGVMISRQAAENTNREAGDGTTTTIVLLQEILKEGHKAVASGMNPILIKKGMDYAKDKVVDLLKENSQEITTDEQKLQVATISSNNDEEVGKMIVSVLNEVGDNGVVTVTTSNALKTEVEYVKGMKFEQGYEAHVFINNPAKLEVELEKPVIIIVKDVISYHSQLVPLMQKLLESGKKEMVLFADNIEGQALAFLIQNHLQGKFLCVPVKLPSFGGFQEDIIFDLAASIGATVLGEEAAKKIEDAEVADCGSAENIIISKYDTIITGGAGDIKERVKQVKALLKTEKDLFNTEKLKERLGRLTGSIAKIKVGGASESEQHELRYRVEDALNATKSAIAEGIVVGGGCALLDCYKELDIDNEDREFTAGVEIIAKALKSPLRVIAENGGQSGEEVVGKVLDHGKGYNALTEKYEDLLKAGIIDPTKVVRNEIQNAISTAGILLTSDIAITIKPETHE